MKYFLAFINTLALFLLIIFTAIEIPVGSQHFYNYEIDKYDMEETTGISSVEFKDEIKSILDYVKSRDKDYFYKEGNIELSKIKIMYGIYKNVKIIVFIIFLISFFISFYYEDKNVFDIYYIMYQAFSIFLIILSLIFGFIVFKKGDSLFINIYNKYFYLFPKEIIGDLIKYIYIIFYIFLILTFIGVNGIIKISSKNRLE